MKSRYFAHLVACAALALAPAAATAQANASNLKEAVDIATDAYVYGYSLVTTDVTRIQMSNMPAVEELKAPPNQFANVKRYPPADYRGVSWAQKSQPKGEQEQRLLNLLKNDPQLRTAFMNKVAGPIANKMFDCGMIP